MATTEKKGKRGKNTYLRPAKDLAWEALPEAHREAFLYEARQRYLATKGSAIRAMARNRAMSLTTEELEAIIAEKRAQKAGAK